MGDPVMQVHGKMRRKCTECGETLRMLKFLSMAGGGTSWTRPSHNARCGLPCSGAAITSIEVYKTGKFHKNNKECVACKAAAEARAAARKRR